MASENFERLRDIWKIFGTSQWRELRKCMYTLLCLLIRNPAIVIDPDLHSVPVATGPMETYVFKTASHM